MDLWWYVRKPRDRNRGVIDAVPMVVAGKITSVQPLFTPHLSRSKSLAFVIGASRSASQWHVCRDGVSLEEVEHNSIHQFGLLHRRKVRRSRDHGELGVWDRPEEAHRVIEGDDVIVTDHDERARRDPTQLLDADGGLCGH